VSSSYFPFVKKVFELDTLPKKLIWSKQHKESTRRLLEMSYTVSVFTNWVSGFESWSALKTWLTSPEGGSLRVVEPKEGSYALVRYVKSTSNFELPHVRWCRSVIVNKETRCPICVAPPKADELTDVSINEAEVAEEFVDGTMVNVFQEREGKAELATRSRLGGRTRFYEQGKTFGEMFEDAMRSVSADSYESLLPPFKDGVARFTSTVLQHPANRLVRSITEPAIYMVHQGTVNADGLIHMMEDAGDFEFSMSESADPEIQAYKLEPIRAAKSVKDWVSQQSQERGFGWQGLVLKDGEGRRWRQRSDMYETVRRFRGNESSVEERFARLRKTRSIDQYVSFYPEDREVLYELEGRLRKNTRQLWHFYSDVFRARKTPYYQLPWPYKHHVSQLHNLYKDTLRAQGKKVDLEQVIRYVNNLNAEDTANMSKVHKLDLVQPKPKVDFSGINWRGDYAIETSYNTKDGVKFQEKYYMVYPAEQVPWNVFPPTAEYWTEVPAEFHPAPPA
jgi:hypothetical protein